MRGAVGASNRRVSYELAPGIHKPLTLLYSKFHIHNNDERYWATLGRPNKSKGKHRRKMFRHCSLRLTYYDTTVKTEKLVNTEYN